MAALIKRFPLPAFFLLSFGYTYSIWGARAYLSHQNGDFEALLMTLHIVGAFGPCLAAVLVSGVRGGSAGIAALFAPYRRWKVGLGWYGFVLLFRPLVWLLALGLYAAFGARPGLVEPMDPGFFLLYLLTQPLITGVGEEAGWAGFALPNLRRHFPFLTANLILGTLWGLWHLPMFFTIGDSQFGTSLVLFVVKLTALRLLFSLSYEMTSSLLMPALFHLSMNALTELVPLAPDDRLATNLLILFSALITAGFYLRGKMGLREEVRVGKLSGL